MARLSKLWIPIGKRLVLTSIRMANGEIVSSSAGRAAQLKEHWSPVFSEKPVSFDHCEQFFEGCLPPFEATDMASPGPDDFAETISWSRDSQPGPNGIPYSGYKVIKEFAGVFFWQVSKKYPVNPAMA